MNGKINILRFSTQSGQGIVCIPPAIRNGAIKVSGIHIKTKVGIKSVKACEANVLSKSPLPLKALLRMYARPL